MKLRTILGFLVAFCTAVAISYAADSNPNMGTWKLNEAITRPTRPAWYSSQACPQIRETAAGLTEVAAWRPKRVRDRRR